MVSSTPIFHSSSSIIPDDAHLRSSQRNSRGKEYVPCLRTMKACDRDLTGWTWSRFGIQRMHELRQHGVVVVKHMKRLTHLTHQPFIWSNQNYRTKMRTDVDFACELMAEDSDGNILLLAHLVCLKYSIELRSYWQYEWLYLTGTCRRIYNPRSSVLRPTTLSYNCC